MVYRNPLMMGVPLGQARMPMGRLAPVPLQQAPQATPPASAPTPRPNPFAPAGPGNFLQRIAPALTQLGAGMMAGRPGAGMAAAGLAMQPQRQAAGPASIQEYEFAKSQGFPGSFMDYQITKRKAGATNVNVGAGKYGKIPAGYELIEGETGVRMQPIAGSPAAIEAQEKQTRETAQGEQTERYSSIVIDDINRARNIVKESPRTTTGVGGQMLSGIGGTQARDLQGLLSSIRANTGFDRLQAMRDASPTGGALGQVSERELAFLQAAIGDLEQSQSPDQLDYNLRRVKNIYLDIIHGQGQGPARDDLTVGGGWQETNIPGVRIRQK